MEEKRTETKLDNLIAFLKRNFPKGIPMFDTRNIVGDPMITIYDRDGICVDECRFCGYIEIFGLTDEEFEKVVNEANGY